MRNSQKGFSVIGVVLALIVIILIGLVGWLAFGNKESSKKTSALFQNNVGMCSFIRNTTFRSIDKHEGGLGPNGEVMGYWEITFKEGTFNWSHSDIIELGNYTCDNNGIKASSRNSSISVEIDSTSKILMWNTLEYKKIK